ncbi:transcription antitermination factor NusB [Salidesulfovibrio onnuriiensis]|uniref:transcription antitermination factor NusB n=1 Tax=Salidesulfovibrio onnuriiensis TaxID=2583823 RepID=UPI0011CBB2E2|nr:transcription antitermination factor NusB [Salidesulfovibrio onnuriiensis]
MKEKKKGNRPGIRRVGRTLAFQVLYGQSFVEASDENSLEKAFLDNPAVIDEESAAAIDFAQALVLGVVRERAAIDAIITDHSQHWKLERIAKVELSILRLSVYEMTRTDIPLRAAINEAIELSKTFGDDNSRGFINGILDAVAKAVSRGNFGVEKQF